MFAALSIIRNESLPRVRSKFRKLFNNSSSDLWMVRFWRIRCALPKVAELTMDPKAAGVTTQSDLGNRATGVQSFCVVLPKTWQPVYFGCVRILNTAR